ncbi:Hypothetical predicted protein [Lecanosticta acicola]|uniref:Uncharacterized protein n=1 Tax=Lecanosticta acicola TaxID=111012 RepID=A0AAI9ECT8_9PEZI|nr:Hypothetical predicted protein [Lecanosticta acicola]
MAAQRQLAPFQERALRDAIAMDELNLECLRGKGRKKSKPQLGIEKAKKLVQTKQKLIENATDLHSRRVAQLDYTKALKDQSFYQAELDRAPEDIAKLEKELARRRSRLEENEKLKAKNEKREAAKINKAGCAEKKGPLATSRQQTANTVWKPATAEGMAWNKRKAPPKVTKTTRKVASHPYTSRTRDLVKDTTSSNKARAHGAPGSMGVDGDTGAKTHRSAGKVDVKTPSSGRTKRKMTDAESDSEEQAPLKRVRRAPETSSRPKRKFSIEDDDTAAASDDKQRKKTRRESSTAPSAVSATAGDNTEAEDSDGLRVGGSSGNANSEKADTEQHPARKTSRASRTGSETAPFSNGDNTSEEEYRELKSTSPSADSSSIRTRATTPEDPACVQNDIFDDSQVVSNSSEYTQGAAQKKRKLEDGPESP